MPKILVSNLICRHCNATNYNAYDSNPGICISCYRKRTYSTLEKNRERYMDRHLRWKEQAKEDRPKWNWSRSAFNALKRRAKLSGIEVKITRDFLEKIAPDFCPALGIKLSYTNSKIQANSPTVDRFDNTKGYVESNVDVISYKANRMKSDATSFEVFSLAEWMRSKLNETK